MVELITKDRSVDNHSQPDRDRQSASCADVRPPVSVRHYTWITTILLENSEDGYVMDATPVSVFLRKILSYCVLLQIIFCLGCQEPRHTGEANWAIQGIYSQPDCANQPGARPWYIENEGRNWFMGCM